MGLLMRLPTGKLKKVANSRLRRGEVLPSPEMPCYAGRRATTPNPSLEPTSSGAARKPAVWLLEHLHTSGLRAAPPGSAQLER
jgi:hypothetical protein